MKKKLFILPILLTFLSISYAEEKGALYYHGDPSELKDSTIEVPDIIVALYSKVKVDIPEDMDTTAGGTPSIFFIIDHSSSMYQNPGNDIDGLRFTATSEFIDSIRAKYPSAEIGIAVFRQHLYFDPADSNFFVPLTAYPQGAYMPFYRIDSAYIMHGGNPGWVVVQNMLKTRNAGTYTDMEYIPTNLATNSGATNINVGFAAAKHAFKSALYMPKRQFIIFLSDGDATIYNGPNSSNTDFVTDVDDLTTTFTVYFTSAGTAPQSIIDMTDNIKSNGFTTNNPQSNLWVIQADTLMNVFMDIFNKIMINIGVDLGVPTDITVNGTKVSNYNTVSHVFLFNDHFPITDVQTDFTYKIDYTIVKDSILPNGDTVVVQGDSTTDGDFSIIVNSTVTDPPDWYFHEFDVLRWDRTLGFLFKNTPITSMNMGMDTLEIRFTEKEIDIFYGYDSISVIITNSKGNIDSETFNLSKTDSCFKKFFPLAIDSTPTQNDGILQLFDSDTVTAVFRNPNLPLDTLVLSVPFYPTTAINPNSNSNQKILSLNIINSSILFNLPTSGKIKLQIYNMKGKLLSTLVDSYKIAGEYKTNWDSKRFGAGVYFLGLSANGSAVSKKFTIIK